MVTLIGQKREKGEKQENMVSGILYGPKIKENVLIKVNLKEFEKVLSEAGESSMIDLKIESEKYPVLIKAVVKNVLNEKPTHVDFYQPKLDEKAQAIVVLVFEGESLAIKTLGGTLVRSISEIEVTALPQDLPSEIKVSIEKLETFEDSITVKDLELPRGVEVSRDLEDVVASVTPPRAEEELEVKTEEPGIEEEAEDSEEESTEKQEETKESEKEE